MTRASGADRGVPHTSRRPRGRSLLRALCLIAALCPLFACEQGGGLDGTDAATAFPAPYLADSLSADADVQRFSRYVRMRDGVRLAVDVYLPAARPDGGRLPAMLHQTRYWRSLGYRWPVSLFKDAAPRGSVAGLARRFLANGYAWVDVDARGSGASFGRRVHSHGPDEIRDGAEIVDWIVRQPWSDGRVGTIGVSYDGTSAEFLLVNRHPAVKAAAPMFSLFDAYADIAFPGGIHHTWFTDVWSDMNGKLDRNDVPFGGLLARLAVTGVRPVDRDASGGLLARALADHRANWNPHREALHLTYRDDVPRSRWIGTIDDLSPHRHLAEIDASGAAVYSYSGWFDGAYARAAIRRHLTLTNPANKLILGPWDHGGRRNISPFSRGRAGFDHAAELLKFFDHHLKGLSNGLAEEKPIHYFTMGEERWKAAETWPPESTLQRWYLEGGGRLSPSPPSAETGADVYDVRYDAGTGPQSRWHTLIGKPITDPYPDRAEQDARLLHYTSEPLAEALEVTGHPLVRLYLSSTATDGNVFVYLEDVDEDGHVAYVTEGLLRVLHRHVSDRRPAYVDPVPHRTYLREDGRPLPPGQIAELVFDLLPTSYRFKAGHRIRVAVAGADTDHFALVPPVPPTVTIHRSRIHASRVELPVVAAAPASLEAPGP